jgi:hypothetical protein
MFCRRQNSCGIGVDFAQCSDRTATLIVNTSVDRKAVEQSCAARAHKVVLAATPAWVCGVPGSVASSAAIEMAELRRACCFAGPVAARVIGAIGVGSAVGLRAGQHVVHVGSIAAAV